MLPLLESLTNRVLGSGLAVRTAEGAPLGAARHLAEENATLVEQRAVLKTALRILSQGTRVGEDA